MDSGCPSGTGRARIAATLDGSVCRQLRHSDACECPACSPRDFWPDAVAITYEMIHDTRVIPIGSGPHAGSAVRGYNGDSRAHWDGNTLVVDTTNFSDKTNFRGSRDTLHIVERFTRDGDGIAYEVTVDDATVWTKPWTAALTLARQPDDSMFEYACHEGNNSMRNILSASRAAEKKTK
jgi:hypothetical protein